VKLWEWAKELHLQSEKLRDKLLLSKDKYKNMVWHNVGESGRIEILENLWDWVNDLQLKPEELRTVVLLSRDKYRNSA
jgi:hypothetical protein